MGKVCLIIAESRVSGNGTAAASHLGSAQPSSSLCSAMSPRGCSNQHRAPEIHATRLPTPAFANLSPTTRKQTPARVAFINLTAHGESTVLHFASLKQKLNACGFCGIKKKCVKLLFPLPTTRASIGGEDKAKQSQGSGNRAT